VSACVTLLTYSSSSLIIFVMRLASSLALVVACVLLLLPSSSSVAAFDCTWTPPGSSHVYDFSEMRNDKTDYTGKSGDFTFFFNPCGNALEPLCVKGDDKVGPGSMCQETVRAGVQNQLTAVLGAWSAKSAPAFKYINEKAPEQGIQISYSNGGTRL
jgi:hypothetical protein